MAGVKVVTRKLTTFHGRDEEYSNVYYFGNGGIGGISGTEAEALINAVINQEKLIFAGAVRFLGGTSYLLDAFHKPQSEPNATVEFGPSVFGTATTSSTMYKECAIDIRWVLTGRRILRSLLHTCANHGLDISGTGSGSPSSALQTFAANMRDANFQATGLRRISPSGQIPGSYTINPYMEHRQFHRYRRRN